VTALTDSGGTVAERYSYNVSGTPYNMSRVGNRFMFAGREYDYETGNYYMRARYYDPWLGRFLNPDPIGYADSMNLYQYCLNNPVNFTDPWGLDTLGIHANGAHVWVTYTTDDGKTKDYGLWHHSREFKLKNATRLRKGEDVWTNASKLKQAVASRYYNNLTDAQKAKWEKFLKKKHIYRYPINNCSSFGSDAVGTVTGEDVDADSWRLGIEHPDEVIKSIQELEKTDPTQNDLTSESEKKSQ
ncbi:MAG: RHS repeat-associated core domain-containing protein, partial [Phycisphaerae bacterium]